MRSIIWLSVIAPALFFASFTACAQAVPLQQAPTINQNIHQMLERQEAKKQAARAVARTTSVTAERLVAQSTYDYYPPDSIMGLQDTINLYYNSNRGSTFNYNSLGYNDNWIYGEYDYGYARTIYTLTGGVVASAGPNYFAQILCDSSHEMNYGSYDTSGHHYISVNALHTYETYTADGHVTSFNSFASSDTSQYTILLTYDGSDNNTQAVYIINGPVYPAMDTQGADDHIFNADGQIITDSILFHSGGALRPSVYITYNYDGSGNLVSAIEYGDSLGTWVEDNQWYMTYNADNLLVADSNSIKIYGTGAWAGNSADSFGYTGGVSYNTYQVHKGYDGPTVYSSLIYTKHINAVGLPDTLYNSLYGYYPTPALVAPAYKQAFTYDASGNPVTAYQYYYHLTDTATGAGYYSASADITTHYYYETYQASGIANHIVSGGAVSIYPNPAANECNIRSALPFPDGSSAQLYDMTGRLCGTYSLYGNDVTIALGSLAPGMYLCRIVTIGSDVTVKKIMVR